MCKNMGYYLPYMQVPYGEAQVFLLLKLKVYILIYLKKTASLT